MIVIIGLLILMDLFMGQCGPLPNNILEAKQGTYSVPLNRGIWDLLGNWIQSSDWFPVQINIPDIFGNIGNGISSFANSIIQRLPFLNRPNNGQGQMKQVTLLVPIFKNNGTANKQIQEQFRNHIPIMMLVPTENLKNNTINNYNLFSNVDDDDDDDIIPYP